MKVGLVIGGVAGNPQPYDFFVEALERHDIVVRRIPGEGARTVALGLALRELRARGEIDRIVLWNADALALGLRSFDGLGRLVIVPASAPRTSSAAWWQQFQTEQFMSFDRSQHGALLAAGLDSAYFQFSPATVPASRLVDVSSRLSAVLWETDGSTPWSIRRAVAQCRVMGLSQLVVARLQDDDLRAGLLDDLGAWLVLPDVGSGRDLAALGQLVAQHPCLIAPDPAHGICPIIMRGIALGRVIVADRGGALVDHIGDGASGLLYDEDDPLDLPWLASGALHDFMRAAKLRAGRAAARWHADSDRLASLVAADGRRWSTTDRSATFRNQLLRNAGSRAWGENVLSTGQWQKRD